jgi:carboxypeptidase C (cathepsin A)
LKLWFQAFPQFKTNKFWISGESYAGIYIPTLADVVMGDSSINFQGILVGNGITDDNYDNQLIALVPFAYFHALIDPTVYATYQTSCFFPQHDQKKCDEVLTIVNENMLDLDIYDIYSDCFHQRSNLQEGIPCSDATKLEAYMNRADVQAAIHVRYPPTISTWTLCSEALHYTRNIQSTLDIYQKLMSKNYKILVYSGDTDGRVPFTGTVAWINSLNLQVNSLWKPWFIKDWEGTQVAGYVTQYEGLTFATIKGAGHMVPQFKPQAALKMFENFIAGKPL